MRKYVIGDHARLEFDSVADLVATAKTHRNARNFRWVEENPGFFGDVSSVDHIFELARVGWGEQLDDTLRVAEDTLATVERSYDLPVWQSYYDVSGADVDVSRYLSGVPENMISYHLVDTPRTGRVASLAVNLGASAAVDAKDMVKRGKSVVALVYALEKMGIRTELYADSQIESRAGVETGRVVVKVKDAADALDPAMVMFAFAHPAFFRGLVLAARHEYPDRFRKSLNIGSSYGVSINTLPDDVFPAGCIVVKTVLRRSDPEISDVEAFVVKHLKDLGLI